MICSGYSCMFRATITGRFRLTTTRHKRCNPPDSTTQCGEPAAGSGRTFSFAHLRAILPAATKSTRMPSVYVDYWQQISSYRCNETRVKYRLNEDEVTL